MSTGRVDLPAVTGLDLSCSLGAFPASCISPKVVDGSGAGVLNGFSRVSVSELPSLESDVPSAVAENLLQFYFEMLDPYIYNAVSVFMKGMRHDVPMQLSPPELLGTLREKSSLLADGICTIAAFCGGPDLWFYYDTCRESLVRRAVELNVAAISQNDASKSACTFGDVLGLCIVAFWLPDLSSSFGKLGE